MQRPYQPINCSFYDLLEADATLGNTSQITYQLEDESITSISGVIKDLMIERGAEYMVLDTGKKIRLDTIIRFNEHPMPKTNACVISPKK